jgi:hypothetical protein
LAPPKRFREGVCRRSRQRWDGRESDTDDANSKQGRSELARKGPERLGRLASRLDVLDAVTVEGNRSGEDDKEL